MNKNGVAVYILRNVKISYSKLRSFFDGTVFYRYPNTFYNKFYKIIIGRERYEYKAFTHHLGYSPDLRNPKSFNEKLAHKKLFDFNPLLPIIADKWRVRDYVSGKVGDEILNKVYQVTSDSKSVQWSSLPESFIVKGTHGSGSKFILPVYDKSTIEENELRMHIDRILQLRFGFATNEWWYCKIPPRVMIEELLVDDIFRTPLDYKYFVFNGKVEIIQVHLDRYSNHSISYYDREWNEISIRDYVPVSEPLERPPLLSEMMSIAERLAEGFDFLRVDLYCINNKIIRFGELTICPRAGWLRFTPREADYFLGSLWK